MGFGVGFEELRVELAEDVADARVFVAEFHAEEVLEEGEEVRGDFGLEVGHVGEGEEEASGLGGVSEGCGG